MKKFFLCVVIGVIGHIGLIGLGAIAYAQHEYLITGLRGPAFSDPSKIQPMPLDWQKQPIKYEPSVGKADIVVTLDQQMYPALQPIIQKYAAAHNLKIVVKEGNCGITTGRITRKEVDIGGVCCPPDATDRLPGLKFHTLGIIPLALFVHPANPIDNITFEQAQKIFQGKIRRWSELKTSENIAPNLPVRPITRLHCKLRPGHWRLLLDKEELFSPDSVEVGAIPDMIFQVAINTNAIGFETIWEVRRHQEDTGRVKVLKINSYDLNESTNVVYLKYPLYHVYSLTTWEDKNVENTRAKRLVKYLMQEIERLDAKFGVIPASRLKQAGWKFNNNELIGEPRGQGL